MTVPNTLTQNGPYFPNGSTAVFPFTFKAVSGGEVQFVRVNADTSETVISSSLYTVSLTDTGSPSDTGGSLTFITPPAASALPHFVRSNPDFTQEISFENERAFLAPVMTEGLDRSAIRDLYMLGQIDRTLQVPTGETPIPVASMDGAVEGSVLAYVDGVLQLIPNDTAAVEQNVADSEAAALASQGYRDQSSAYALQSGASAAQSGVSAAASNTSAGIALGAQAATTIAAATVGVYPNAAGSNVPRGLTQASVGAITAGSGGTDGTFALAWSGGNFLVNPTGTFTVAGGVLTAVTITGPGLYIGASPTVPTPSFAASSGLTGAAVALTAQFLIASGVGYWVQSADTKTYGRYYNASGVATADTGVQSIPASPSLTSLIAQLSETVTNTWGVTDPVTGGASTGSRWVFLNTTAPYDILVTSMLVSVTATGPQKLEISYPPAPTNRVQVGPDVIVTPTTTGVQTLVAPTHFTAFTIPAGAQVGQFGNWVGFVSVAGQLDAAVCGGVDGDTTYTQSAPSAVTFQIRLTGTRSQPIALESRLNALDSAVTYAQSTVTQIGASDVLRAGGAATSPNTALWTLSTAIPVAAPVDQVFFDAKTTGTLKVKLMRSGSQVGADVSITVSATGPQTATVNLTDARIGDKIRFTGITVGYTTPSGGDDAATDELSFPTYGFRLGYRQTYVATQPLKDKVAAIAAGGSDLINKIACWGDSLFEYPQHPSMSVSAQLATLLGVTTYNGGISGQTMPQIETRFNVGSDKWGWITIFEAYNGFNNPDADLAALDRMVAKLLPAKSKRFLVLSCWNGDTQPVGSAGYNQIALLNKRRQAAYPYNYVDWRTHIIQNGLNVAGINPTSGDLTDIANDVIPRSLRLSGDFLHGNDSAYTVAAKLLENIVRSNHWLSA